jgi:hypothetical protein
MVTDTISSYFDREQWSCSTHYVNVGEVAALLLRGIMITRAGLDVIKIRALLQIAGHAISQGQEATGVSGLARNDFCENNIKRRAHSLFRFKMERSRRNLCQAWYSWYLTWSDCFLVSTFNYSNLALQRCQCRSYAPTWHSATLEFLKQLEDGIGHNNTLTPWNRMFTSIIFKYSVSISQKRTAFIHNNRLMLLGSRVEVILRIIRTTYIHCVAKLIFLIFWKVIHNSNLSIYGSTALCLVLAAFQFLTPIRNR